MKKYLLPFFMVTVLCTMFSISNTVFAFDIERASPNELTPEKSREIYDQQLIDQNINPSDTASDPNRIPDYTYDPSYGIVDEADLSQTPQQSQERKDREYKEMAIKIIVVVSAVIVLGSILYFNRNKLLRQKKRFLKK